jgi:hypothetical protein
MSMIGDAEIGMPRVAKRVMGPNTCKAEIDGNVFARFVPTGGAPRRPAKPRNSPWRQIDCKQ